MSTTARFAPTAAGGIQSGALPCWCACGDSRYGMMLEIAPPEKSGKMGAAATFNGTTAVNHLTMAEHNTITPYDRGVRVSTRGDYACRALLSLALHADSSGPTSVRDIAERTALPQPYLEQILLALKGAGLVKSKRGVGGGYVLARDPADIKLSEVISAVDGPITIGDFGQPHEDEACNHEGQCVLLAIWGAAGDHMKQHLEQYTLAGIANAARGVAPWPAIEHTH